MTGKVYKGFWACIFFGMVLHAQENVEIPEKPLSLPEIRDEWVRTKRGSRYVFADTHKLLFAGDTMFNWGVRDAIRDRGQYRPFQEWVPVFRKADLRFLNLETPLLKKEKPGAIDKPFVFYGLEEDAQILKNLSISAVFLGNNHSMDFGAEGLRETLDILKDNGIAYLGADVTANLAYSPRSISHRGINYLLFSASEVGERHLYAKGDQPGTAYFHERHFVMSVQKYSRKKEPVIPILSLHWGWEYNPQPTPGQRKSAYKMIDAGYTAIVGHHPHIPQGIEIYKGKPIIYSLGNFVFGSQNSYLNHNIVVILHYRGGSVQVVEVVPAFGKFQEDSHNFYPLDPVPAEKFLEEYAVLCSRLGTQLEIRGGRGYVFLDRAMTKTE